MNILAIDTALSTVSVCVANMATYEVLAFEVTPMERGHAEHVVPAIERTMRAVDGSFDSLSRIAVTVGPGSFTGIRVGIAAAKAIGLVRQLPVVGVSTLSALAAPHLEANCPHVIACSIDARRERVYFQAFSPGGKTLVGPAIGVPREAIRGIGSGPVRLVGSGSMAMAREAALGGLRVEAKDDARAPEIAYVARLGALARPEQAPARPLYLSPAEARPMAPKAARPVRPG